MFRGFIMAICYVLAKALRLNIHLQLILFYLYLLNCIDFILTSFYLFDLCFYSQTLGTAVAQWLRCCATNRKFAGSIPASVSRFFFDIKSFRSHYGPGVDSDSNRNEY